MRMPARASSKNLCCKLVSALNKAAARPALMPEKGMMRGGGPMAQLFGGDDRDFRNGHGLVGEILSVADDSLVVKDISGNESVVSLGKQTLIKNGRSDAVISGLKPGDKIAVIGRPADDGMIEARLIRVLPELRDKEER